jgi:hypothetical protein
MTMRDRHLKYRMERDLTAVAYDAAYRYDERQTAEYQSTAHREGWCGGAARCGECDYQQRMKAKGVQNDQ